MAERKKFKQKHSGSERASNLDTLFPGSEDRARVSGFVERLSGVDGINGLVLGKNRSGGNRTFYVVARGGTNGEDPLKPATAIEQTAMDEYFQAFDDQRSRWNVEVKVVTEIGLQRSRKDFANGKGQILTTVWHRG